MEMHLKIAIICLSLTYLVNGQTYLYGCPTSINGCTCARNWVNSEYVVVVTCNGFNGNINDFKKNLQALNGYEIDELSITSYGLLRLPEGVFTSTLIRKVTLLNSPNLQYLGTTTTFFDGLGPSLETIRIENTPNIREDQWTKLATSLTSGSILRHLYFYNNNAFSLRSFDAFSTLVNLQRIVWRRNKIIYFESDLSKFPKLRFIDLSENPSLDNFLVTGVSPQLSTLYLNGDSIRYLTEVTFKNMEGIQSIDLSGNPLSCDCNDIDFIIKNSTLTSYLKGTCTTPQALNNKPFGSCITGGRLLTAENIDEYIL